MQENILEHTTSIAGLTCKPLSILSETISPQEMSRARGGWDTIPSMLDSLATNEDTVEPPKDPTAGAPEPTDEGGGSSRGSSVSTLGWNIGLWWPSSGSSESDTPSSPDTPSLPDTPSPIDPGPDNENEDEDDYWWEWDFGYDDTEDECTVPYDCGDEDNDDDNYGSGVPDEENSMEGNDG